MHAANKSDEVTRKERPQLGDAARKEDVGAGPDSTEKYPKV